MGRVSLASDGFAGSRPQQIHRSVSRTGSPGSTTARSAIARAASLAEAQRSPKSEIRIAQLSQLRLLDNSDHDESSIARLGHGGVESRVRLTSGRFRMHV